MVSLLGLIERFSDLWAEDRVHWWQAGLPDEAVTDAAARSPIARVGALRARPLRVPQPGQARTLLCRGGMDDEGRAHLLPAVWRPRHRVQRLREWSIHLRQTARAFLLCALQPGRLSSWRLCGRGRARIDFPR